MKGLMSKIVSRITWTTIFLFVIRCMISFSDLKSQCSVYMIFSYASEAIAVAGLLFLLYEKYLWKKDKFLGVPILEEKYKGTIFSTYDNKERNVEFSIKQSLFSIVIIMNTEESHSTSMSASLDSILGEKTIVYTYMNKPSSSVRDRSEVHFGTAVLNVEDVNHIKGDYFTDRKSIGSIDVKPVIE